MAFLELHSLFLTLSHLFWWRVAAADTKDSIDLFIFFVLESLTLACDDFHFALRKIASMFTKILA